MTIIWPRPRIQLSDTDSWNLPIEMSRRRRSRSSSRSFSVKKKRTGLRTIVETVMGVSAALIIILAFCWWFFLRERPQETAVSDVVDSAVDNNVVVESKSFNEILASGDLKAMNQLLLELESWRRDAATPVRLETLNHRLQLAEKVMQHPDLSELQRISTAKTILNAIGQIYGISSAEGILDDGTTVSRYLSICNTFIGDQNKEVAREAHVSKAKLLVFEMTRGTRENSSETIQQTIFELIERYPNDPDVATDIRLLHARVKSTDPRAGSKMIREIVGKYEQLSPTDPDVRVFLRNMKDQIVHADSDIGVLAREAMNSGDYEGYLKKLFELIDLSETGVGLVNFIYREIAAFESNGQLEIARRAFERLEESASNRTDPVAKDQALRVAKWGLIRVDAVGKKLDLSDTDSNGNSVDASRFANRPCIVFYYSPNDRGAGTVINRLNFAYQNLARTNVQIVAIAVEKSDQEKFESGFDPSWVNIQSNPPVEPSQIFMRLPVSHVPFFAVLNQDGEVVSTNVPEEKLKTVVERLAAPANQFEQPLEDEIPSENPNDEIGR